MGRKKSPHAKTKVVQIRISEAEYNAYKFRARQFHKHTGIKINTSELIRVVLSRADNAQYLHMIGYLSYLELMDSQMFNKTKYPRLKKCKSSL